MCGRIPAVYHADTIGGRGETSQLQPCSNHIHRPWPDFNRLRQGLTLARVAQTRADLDGTRGVMVGDEPVVVVCGIGRKRWRPGGRPLTRQTPRLQVCGGRPAGLMGSFEIVLEF